MIRWCAALLASLGAGLAVATPATSAECSARFGTVDGPAFTQRGYDIFAAEPLRGSAGIEVVNPGGGSCRVIVTLSSERAGARRLRGGGEGLRYLIRRDAPRPELVENLSSPARSGVLRAGLGPQERASFPLRLEVPEGQIVAAGAYAELVTATLYNAPTLAVLARRELRVETVVTARADVSLSTRRTGFDLSRTYDVLDLGRLETGERGTAYLRVRASSAFALALSSENGGRLVRDRGGDAIAYELRLDGQAIALGRTAREVRSGPRPTPPDGVAFTVEVVVGDVARRRAGVYRDLLRVRVRPLE
jgi:hypothetical protein